jgi:hypothetical protein
VEPSESAIEPATDAKAAAFDGGRVTRRRFLGSAALAAGATFLELGTPAWASPDVRGTGSAAACSLPADVRDRIVRGYRRDRSGQLMIVPHGFDFVSGGISHSTPFAYTQDVPMLWYGPGFVGARGSVDRPVTLADVAPTIANLIGFDWTAPDGHAMTEALVPGLQQRPKLVIVLVLDGAGRFVLDLFPKAWPNIRSLIPEGTWFDAATVGSSPSNTAPAHASIGTGAFPFRHGVLDNYIRFPSLAYQDPYAAGPNFALLNRTLAEEYAAAAGPDATVGLCATVSWHLGMLGRGSDGGTGPATMAILKEGTNRRGPTSPRWGLPAGVEPFYRCPDYVNDPDVVPPIDTFWHVAETLAGGQAGSDLWRGHDIGQLQGGFHTPARIPFQQALVEAVIDREGFGTHQEPDLLFLNYKLIDEIGHMFTASSPEMRDSVMVQDRYLARFVSFLEDRLPGQYVLLLTADHGHTAAPSSDGGFAISEPSVLRLIAERFGTDSFVDVLRPIWLDLDTAEMKANGITLDQLARFLAGLTKAQTARPNVVVPRSQAGERVFDAVFAGSLLSHLPCR